MKSVGFALLTLVCVAGCTFEESEAQRASTYPKNVESCVCRSLDFEADSYSGITYENMVVQCNVTVHRANQQRYDASAYEEPGIESLRCPDSVEEWRETAVRGFGVS